MDFEITPEQQQLVDSVRDVLRRECPTALVRDVVENGSRPEQPWKSAHELGWAATYLCSPFAAYVTGLTFVVDGANWQRRGLKMPAVVPIREQLPKRPPR